MGHLEPESQPASGREDVSSGRLHLSPLGGFCLRKDNQPVAGIEHPRIRITAQVIHWHSVVTGKDPGVHYCKLTQQFGDPVYERADAPATPAQKALLERLSPEMVAAQEPVCSHLRDCRIQNA